MNRFIFLSLVILCSLKASFVSSQNWQSDWEETKLKSKQTNKKIVLVFSGSDWCIPCIKLEKEIWTNPEFIFYAEENYLLFRADFPKRKKNKLPNEIQDRNDQIASVYNPSGYFPLVVILNSNVEVIGRLGYDKIPVKSYIQNIEDF
ncbi:MAG: thioredoxin family protein [Flavobacteriaceae bacterium]|nr:thioredoxin family protein [Flavobacteriaceae bacterium]